ncbi:MAG: UDP-glucose 4-epimerase GalE [Acidobacteria bacterium]|nr:UDP-glucose 4-epimerase GalE [Acidobacteriota bacterium]
MNSPSYYNQLLDITHSRNILVTGGAGYIGSHTVHRLAQRGYDVTVVDDLSRGYRHNVDAARLRELNLADTPALEKLLAEKPFSAVIHFAAYIAVGESMVKPELHFSNNLGGSLSLLSAMTRAGVRRLVFSSTAAVYGTPETSPVTEQMPHAPVSPYGESKVMVERILGWFDGIHQLRSIALRYFNASGADPASGLGEEHDPETHLIPLLLRAVLTGQPITLFGTDYDTPDGTCIRDYVHVADLAEAHVLALEALLAGSASDAFNVGTGRGHSVREVIRAVEEVTGRAVPVRVGPRREGDPPVLVACSDKLRRALGWKPRYEDLREIVATAWEFEKSRRPG